MKRILFSLFVVNCLCFAGVAGAEDFSCGPGYILVERSDIDDINAVECQKLWCRDLETGKPMGSGDRANSGYQATSYPMEL